MPVQVLTQLPFAKACEAWLESRRYHIAPITFKDYGYYIKQLARTFQEIFEESGRLFFDQLRIQDIDGDLMRSYQHKRRASASPELINKELGIIVMVRKRIGMPLPPEEYQRLQRKKDYETPGRALTTSEEAIFGRVCKAAADHKKWDMAALCSILAMNTGLAPCEILNAKIKDVTIGVDSTFVIQRRGAKRVSRERVIVLVGDAEWAAIRMLKRARDKCGACEPEHFLVPATNRDHSFDPLRPATGYRSSMEKLLSLAETEFRRYDLRHHAMSVALRNPAVSLAAAREHFGHIDNRMQRRYYHGNLETMRVVAAAIAGKKAVQKDGTTLGNQGHKKVQKSA